MKIALATLIGLFLLSGALLAQPGRTPPEAISACSGSSEGSSCSFQGMRGDTLSGTCHSVDSQLACAPEGMPMGGGNRGPR